MRKSNVGVVVLFCFPQPPTPPVPAARSYAQSMTSWVIFAGLPGTGKSTLARALAQQMDAAVLDKDRVRAALFPAEWIDYSAQQAKLCMQAMMEAAAYLTQRGRPAFIFFDGRTFSRRAHLQEVVSAAEMAGARWRILHVFCEDAVAEQRLGRTDQEHPAQNRNPALYHSLQKQFEPITYPHLLVDTTSGFLSQIESIEAYLSEGAEPSR